MFPLPWSPSATSGETPPLVLLLLPLTDICIRVKGECLSGMEVWEHFLQVQSNSSSVINTEDVKPLKEKVCPIF